MNRNRAGGWGLGTPGLVHLGLQRDGVLIHGKKSPTWVQARQNEFAKCQFVVKDLIRVWLRTMESSETETRVQRNHIIQLLPKAAIPNFFPFMHTTKLSSVVIIPCAKIGCMVCIMADININAHFHTIGYSIRWVSLAKDAILRSLALPFRWQFLSFFRCIFLMILCLASPGLCLG